MAMSPDKLAKLMAAFPAKALENGNYRTCPVRLSYPQLFKPAVGKKFRNDPAAKPKFSVTSLFPKGANLDAIRAAVDAVSMEAFKTTKKVDMPFKDQGEEEGAGYVPGAVFIRSTADNKPKVKLRRNGELVDASEEDVYPGVWALVTVRPFASDYGTKRVSLGLQNVLIIADDDRLGGGGSRAEDDFAAIDALDDVFAEADGAAAFG